MKKAFSKISKTTTDLSLGIQSKYACRIKRNKVVILLKNKDKGGLNKWVRENKEFKK